MTTAPHTAADIVLHQIELHEHEEEEILNAYSDGARNARDPGIRFLMDLIHEDEERHHRLMTWMANGIRHSLHQMRGPAALPAIAPEAGAQTDLLGLTEHFLEVERSAIRGLQDIAHTVQWIESPATTLLGQIELPKPACTADWMRRAPVRLVLESMMDDSRKHIRILEHVKARLSGKGGLNGHHRKAVREMLSVPSARP